MIENRQKRGAKSSSKIYVFGPGEGTIQQDKKQSMQKNKTIANGLNTR
mgnify:CR=1 FL=1